MESERVILQWREVYCFRYLFGDSRGNFIANFEKMLSFISNQY